MEKGLRLALAFLLGLAALGSVVIGLLNPESYLLGNRVSGIVAAFHLFLLAGVALYTINSLLTEKPSSPYLSMGYFAYTSAEVISTNYSLGQGLAPSPLFTLGLTLSLVYIFARERLLEG